jgi:hypothetical protein
MKIVQVIVTDVEAKQNWELSIPVPRPDQDGKIRAQVGEFLTTHIGKYKYKTTDWIHDKKL